MSDTTKPTAADLRAEHASTLTDLRARLSSREAMTRDWVENVGTHEYTAEDDGTILDGEGETVSLSDVWLQESTQIIRDFINQFEGTVTFDLGGEYRGTELRETYVGATPDHTVTVLIDTQAQTITLRHDKYGILAATTFTDAAGIDRECLEMFQLARG